MATDSRRRTRRQTEEKEDTETMVTGPRTVEVTVEEIELLRKLQAGVTARKVKGKARAEARKELIRKYKPEYDQLVVRFTPK